jgi:hypothetical protein
MRRRTSLSGVMSGASMSIQENTAGSFSSASNPARSKFRTVRLAGSKLIPWNTRPGETASGDGVSLTDVMRR